MPNRHRRWARSAPQGLSITDQLVEIACPASDLRDRPVTDCSPQCCHINLVEEVTKRGIRWWAAQLQAQRFCKHAVVEDGKAFQIPQALAAALGASLQRSSRTRAPQPGAGTSRNANARPHPGIRDRLEVANQIEIACGRRNLEHRDEAIPPTSTHADSSGKRSWD